MTMTFFVNVTFWLCCIVSGAYAIFSKEWMKEGRLLKSWQPHNRKQLYRVAGFFLFFLGSWMILALILSLMSGPPPES